jgi:hypothetical protein
MAMIIGAVMMCCCVLLCSFHKKGKADKDIKVDMLDFPAPGDRVRQNEEIFI